MSPRTPLTLLLLARRGLGQRAAFLSLSRAVQQTRRLYHGAGRGHGAVWGGVAALVGGGVASLCASVAADQPSVAALVAEADQLYEDMKYEDICSLLTPYKNTKSDEILWRLGRATYELAKAAASEEERRQLFREALDHVEAALAINTENFAVHKWMSILIDFVYAAEGTKARISKSYVVKEHMIKACQLNPGDATSRYLLGFW